MEKIITGIKVPTYAEILTSKTKLEFAAVPKYDQLTQYVTQTEGVKGADGVTRFGVKVNDIPPEELAKPFFDPPQK